MSVHLQNTVDYLNGIVDYYQIGPDKEGSSKGSSSYEYRPHSRYYSSSTTVINNVVGGGVVAADPATIYAMDSVRRREKEEDRQTTAAVLGGIGAVFFAFLSGYVMKSAQQTAQQIDATTEFKSSTYPRLELDQRAKLQPVLREHTKILENLDSKNRVIKVVVVGLAGGCATAFLGGMMGASSLITVATLAIVFFAIIGAAALGWHCGDQTTLSNANCNKVMTLIEEFQAIKV